MPAYVPGFDYDLFVSYAHVDDALVFQSENGWVTRLLQNLQNLLAQKLGRREIFQVWWDRRDLRGHHQIDGIAEEVKRSALLMLVLSPGYLHSDYCLRELEAFRKAHRAGVRGRIFVAEFLRPDADMPVPPDIGALKNYRFWQLDEYGAPRPLGLMSPNQPEPAYCQQVMDLASDLAAQMKSLRIAAGLPLPVETVPARAVRLEPRAAVLLADTTDDLLDARDELCRYLELEGIATCPLHPYPADPDRLRAEMGRDLSNTAAFVQLLDPFAGRKPGWAPGDWRPSAMTWPCRPAGPSCTGAVPIYRPPP